MPRFRFSGQKYRAAREELGVSRLDVACSLGCSYALVASVESDRYAIGVEKAARFANALGRHVDDFIVPVDESVPA